jgi:D-sedoheptulose 7-phosphate isomerase
MKELITHSLGSARTALDGFIAEGAAQKIEAAARIVASAFQAGGKVISCGNGGSLCDATHFAEEFTGRFRKNRRPLPAIAINDPAYITCVANDYSFDEIFSRYVEGVGCEGDVLLAISTSGNSENVVRAAEAARARGMKVISLTGKGGGRLAGISDVSFVAPPSEYSDRAQEIHIKIIHIMIEAVEALLEQ